MARATATTKKKKTSKTRTAKSGAGKKAAKASAGKKTAKAGKTTAKASAGKKTAKASAGKKAAKSGAGKKTAKASAGKKTAKSGAGKKTAKASAGKTAAKAGAGKKAAKSGAGKKAAKASAGKKAASAGKKTAKVASEARRAGKVEIADPGLLLAVLDQLLHSGVIEEATIEEAIGEVDPDGEESERAAEALKRLQTLPLDAAAVAAITALDFDGGNDIYMLVEQALDIYTGGEESYYELHSLAGIDQLPALVSLNLDGHGYRAEELDLGPLSGHPTLARVTLSGRCTHAEALEALPKLAELRATPNNIDSAVLERLKARGVEIP